MNSIRLITALLLVSWQFAVAGEDVHVGTWELRKFEMTGRAGQDHQVHRLVLTADGRYLNSATRGGPIPVKYKLEKDEKQLGWHTLLIEAPDGHGFGRGAGIRVDKRGLIMEYFDGRILTYTRISPTADLELLVNPKGKTITIQSNKKE